MFPIQDPILTFTLLMLMIFVAPLAAVRLKVPDLVLLIVGGALLGPNGFGMMERNSAVTMLGSIGLLYIMFIAGLEIDLNRFMRTRNRSIVFGLFTFSIPLAFGTAAARYLLNFDWMTSVLLASMLSSHTLLAYPIASRFGITRSEPVVITVGGTIITDTLALLVLAVVADSARGVEMGAMFWVMLAVGMAGLILLTSFVVPWITRWFFRNVTESGGAQFLFVIVVVCGCAYLSHFAKMEPIIGAFLVGAVFSRLIPERSALMNRLLFVGNTLFIPFFLISVGMLVNLRVMAASPRGWLVAAVMVISLIITKYLAAWVTQKLFKYGGDAGRVIFGLSVVQSAATLAAVIVGYELKIFDETVLNGAIVMILISCLLGVWTVDRYGRSLVSDEAPPDEALPAEERLMVSVINPDYSLRLLKLSFLLRDRSRRGSIYPVTIVNDLDETDDAVARGEKLLTSCLTEGASAEMEVTPSVRVDLNPSDGLVRAARELRATLVLAGWSRKRLIESRFFGSVSEKLLVSCPARLLFCRLVRPLNLTKRMLLPFPVLAERRSDLTVLLNDAKQLSRQIGAALRVYLVLDERSGLRKKVESAKPTCPLTVIEAASWTEMQSQFLADISPDDLILLPTERRSGVLWTPAMDILLETVFARFPENNLLSAYPALQSYRDEEIQSAPAPRVAPNIFSADIPAGLEGKAGLALMIGAAFGNNAPFYGDIMPLVLKAADAYPLELAEEIALIHAHSENIFTPVIIVGRSEQQWRFRNLKGAYRIILVLVSPRSAPPEQHLRILADLARNFLDPELTRRACQAGTAGEIARLIQSGSKAPSA